MTNSTNTPTPEPTKEDIVDRYVEACREAGVSPDQLDSETIADCKAHLAEPVAITEPDELDKRIAKEFPLADEAARKAIRARVLKRHSKTVKQEEKRESIDDRIRKAPNIEGLNLMRVAILRGFQLGTLNPGQKALDRWNLSVWFRVTALMQEAKTPEHVCFIYNFVYKWPKDPIIAQVLKDTLEKVCARLPNKAERLLARGVEIVGVTKLPPAYGLDSMDRAAGSTSPLKQDAVFKGRFASAPNFKPYSDSLNPLKE
jgi:hypothetical protein